MTTALAERRAPNPEQHEAIEAPGVVFVSAGAGTGKTTVLVERFRRAVCDRGLSVDSVLVVTYTERAAGELRGRIRERLRGAGRPDLARELDGAWISTIHGFCLRLLRAHPFAAGLDPRFRVLDDSQARVLRGEAFERALAEFCAGDDPQRQALLATYGARGLRRMLVDVHETLRSAGRELVLALGERPALAERVEELRAAARCALAETEGLEKAAAAREAVAAALALLERDVRAERLLDLGGVAAKGPARERFAAYEEARRAVERAALDELALRDRDLLQELLTAFAEAYRGAKEREAAVDFEDLQLHARDLLRDREDVRTAERFRFRSIMVDEFQDTNRLQCELVDLLAADDTELFFVGDEFQSIYRFRHADVGVFRERRAAAPRPLALTHNYRSRPEVLAVVNHLFAIDFGEEFRPLEAAGRFDGPVFGPAVELLVTDKSSYRDTGTHWRAAEARHVARRLRELVDAGEAAPGEIVLLFAAGTDAELYETELRAAGLPTYRATGRGYLHQQQVVDVLAYLRLLHNRYDDEALVSVLASPLVGVSNDALVLLRRAASRRPLFAGLERAAPPGLARDDERLFHAFRQRYERLAALAPGVGLERLVEAVVAEHDYDLAVLAQWDGRRRYANLRKLGRVARSFEELRGRDVEGFVRFVREQELAGAKELEAAAAEEGADAVRLLTIHAAKGLEFKVVVVADAGRDARPPGGDEIICLPDGRFGFRVADPLSGKRRGAFDYDDVRAAERAADEAERRRLYYVAMTRAVDRLIVSGSIDPEGRRDETTPIGWVLGRLGGGGLVDGPLELEGGGQLVVRVERFAPEPVEAAAPDEQQLALFAPGEPLPARREEPPLPPLQPLPEPAAHDVRTLSFSALALHARCPYRFFVQRLVGLPERGAHGAVPGQAGLAATELGDAVHALLERVDPRAPRPPAAGELAAFVRSRYPAATDEELARIGAFAAVWCDSALARRVAALDGAAPERPFAFEHDGVLLHGRLDLLHRADGRALVVDYKTNALGDRSPEELVETDYRLQRLVYALALLRAGDEQAEIVYTFLERADAVCSATFARAELPALEAELSAAVAEIRDGRFRPTPSEHACSGCPALDLVCAGPRLGDPGYARA